MAVMPLPLCDCVGTRSNVATSELATVISRLGNCAVPILSTAERTFDRELLPIFINDNQKKLRVRHLPLPPTSSSPPLQHVKAVGSALDWWWASASSSGLFQRHDEYSNALASFLGADPKYFMFIGTLGDISPQFWHEVPPLFQSPLGGEYVKMLAAWTLAEVSGSRAWPYHNQRDRGSCLSAYVQVIRTLTFE
jgi:hypothetical protein